MAERPLRIATRASALALAQAELVAAALGGAELVTIETDGEKGDKSRFVRGVERALLAGEADLGVHSAKDMPADTAEGLVFAAVPARESAGDDWIGAGDSLAAIPEGARVGTASPRRRAQLLAARPDLRVEELHGNVDTRLRLLAEGDLDGIVLARAGLRRLGRESEATFALPAEAMTPAAGQGALVIQARAGDERALGATADLGNETALRELTAERAAVAMLDADCTSPVGVHARAGAGTIAISAFVGLPDGSEWLRDEVEVESDEPAAVGAVLAERLLAAGAADILDRAGRAR